MFFVRNFVLRTFFIAGDNMKETINERIAKYRRLRHITQDEMAEILDMPSSTYGNKEKRGKIDCEFLIKISEILNVDIRSLLFENEFEDKTAVTPKTNITDDEWNLIALYRIVSEEKKNRILQFALNSFKE